MRILLATAITGLLATSALAAPPTFFNFNGPFGSVTLFPQFYRPPTPNPAPQILNHVTPVVPPPTPHTPPVVKPPVVIVTPPILPPPLSKPDFDKDRKERREGKEEREKRYGFGGDHFWGYRK